MIGRRVLLALLNAHRTRPVVERLDQAMVNPATSR